MLLRAWMANPGTADGLVRPNPHAAMVEPCLVDLGTKRVECFHDQVSGRLIELDLQKQR